MAMNKILTERCIKSFHRCMPVSTVSLYTSSRGCSGYSLAKNLKDCYYVLRVSEESSDDEIKVAYINLAKEYHPDSHTSTADPKKFSQIEQAYRAIQEHRRKQATEKREKEEVAKATKEQETFFDIRHTAPQHRQYLNHEGKGSGNPFQREKQYKAYKVIRASENVYEHQVQKWSAKYEKSLVTKDKEATRKRTIRNQMERLVEDYIQEAMSRGEFSNLKGQGKPLQLPPDHNPMIDKTTHQLNRILINNGFAPEWIMLDKEIRQQIKSTRDNCLLERTKAGDLDQLDTVASRKWKEARQHFRTEIRDINKKIQKLNLIIPTLQQQMFPYNEEKELKKMLDLYAKLYASGNLPEIPSEEKLTYDNILRPPKDNEKVTAKMIWRDIRALFSS